MISNTQFDIKTPQFDTTQQTGIKKYLPVSATDKDWGLVIHDVGEAVIHPNSAYPPQGHPGSHRFSWEKGRILNEPHFVMITQGKGIFESRSAGVLHLHAGDGFLLFPHEWHRYKPIQSTGWTEQWVGFSGEIAELIMKKSFFDIKKPVVPNCATPDVKNLFTSLLHLIIEEPFGFQRTASGICLQLLATLCNIQKSPDSNRETNSALSKAKILMNQKIDGDFDLHAFCSEQGITYSKFRKDFKAQTGMAPLHYFLLIKIEKAKELLTTTNLRTKQIAFSLGFCSDHYFSRLFRARTGLSPLQYRSQKQVTTNAYSPASR